MNNMPGNDSNNATAPKTNDIVNKVADKAHGMTDSVARNAQDAAKATSDKANETANKVADKATDLTDSAAKGAQDAVQATRDTANEVIEKAQDKVKQWSNEIDPAISDLAAKAQALAEKSINYCAETSTRLREQMDDATVATTRYVTQQPGKSLMIAAATGSLLTMVAMMLSRSRD